MKKPEITAIVDNAVKVGKFKRDAADKMMGMATDDKKISAMLGVIRGTPLNPDNLPDHYPKGVTMNAHRSYDELEANRHGSFNLKNMAEAAPEIYKSKFVEKHGRLPSAMPARPYDSK